MSRLHARPHTESSLLALGGSQLARSACSAGFATLVDYCSFNAVLFVIARAPLATLLGALVGGLTNFLVNRRWVFDGTRAGRGAALRYAVVSGLSAWMNAGWVALWTTVLPTQFAWCLARVLVFLCWNHPLQRDWVFRSKNR